MKNKKYFRDVYLIGISFIAGVLFIVQCGGSAKSMAESVMQALNITFDNAATGLSADNVQDAVTELAHDMPMVYDAEGNKIGVLININNGPWIVWDNTLKIPFKVNPSTGEVVVVSNSDTYNPIYFTSTDCSGTPYLSYVTGTTDSSSYPVQANGQLYWYQFQGGAKAESDILSAMDLQGNCSSGGGLFVKKVVQENELENEPIVFIEAEAIAEPSYQGPLFLH